MTANVNREYADDRGRTRVELMTLTETQPWDATTPPPVLAAEGLLRDNYAVVDTFMDPREAQLLRDEVQLLHADGRMKPGEIGAGVLGGDGSLRASMRSDHAVYMEGSEPFVQQYMKRHIRRVDIFAQKIAILLNAIAPEHTWAGAGRTKVMATFYSGETNSYYCPHIDNPNSNGRKLTALLYLNEGWRPEHGGVLRMKPAGKQIDVAPLFNRMLVFWSDRRCPHEVLPAQGRDRFAVTVWYLDADERAKAEAKVAAAVAAATK
jgi:hypoxia-inducible factor (prolyl hydroxylase)